MLCANTRTNTPCYKFYNICARTESSNRLTRTTRGTSYNDIDRAGHPSLPLFECAYMLRLYVCWPGVCLGSSPAVFFGNTTDKVTMPYGVRYRMYVCMFAHSHAMNIKVKANCSLLLQVKASSVRFRQNYHYRVLLYVGIPYAVHIICKSLQRERECEGATELYTTTIYARTFHVHFSRTPTLSLVP